MEVAWTAIAKNVWCGGGGGDLFVVGPLQNLFNWFNFCILIYSKVEYNISWTLVLMTKTVLYGTKKNNNNHFNLTRGRIVWDTKWNTVNFIKPYRNPVYKCTESR